MKLYAAPLQGFTEAPWRNAHDEVFGGIDAYYTPFVRIEHETFRAKDLRDIAPDCNTVPHLVPQLLASKPDEMSRIVELFLSNGYMETDINIGCPFPPITNKHKGSGILPYPDELRTLLKNVNRYPEMMFSVKMRLGLESADEYKELLPLLNETPLERITIHPRIGRQQYRGDVNLDEFSEFYRACTHKIVYNGDVQTIDDIHRIESAYPELDGIMIGRGLLSRPSLAMEYCADCTLGEVKLNEKVMTLHDKLFEHYSRTLHGESQLLAKLKPYWEYMLPSLDKKIRKAIKKSTTLAKYQSAIALIR